MENIKTLAGRSPSTFIGHNRLESIIGTLEEAICAKNAMGDTAVVVSVNNGHEVGAVIGFARDAGYSAYKMPGVDPDVFISWEAVAPAAN